VEGSKVQGGAPLSGFCHAVERGDEQGNERLNASMEIEDAGKTQK
jgi:hypothetical protein